jgi:hypothetical protein
MGFYDPALWCEACESESSKIENIVIPVLLDIDKHKSAVRTAIGKTINKNGEVLLWELSIDPLAMHKFVLSVLWRCSASTIPEFNRYSLNVYQQRILDALKSRNSEDLEAFPYILRYEKNPDLRGGFITPGPVKLDGVRFAHFTGGGLAYDVRMSKQPLPDYLCAFASGPKGPVYLMSYSLPTTRVGGALIKRVQASGRVGRVGKS